MVAPLGNAAAQRPGIFPIEVPYDCEHASQASVSSLQMEARPGPDPVSESFTRRDQVPLSCMLEQYPVIARPACCRELQLLIAPRPSRRGRFVQANATACPDSSRYSFRCRNTHSQWQWLKSSFESRVFPTESRATLPTPGASAEGGAASRRLSGGANPMADRRSSNHKRAVCRLPQRSRKLSRSRAAPKRRRERASRNAGS